MDSNMEKSKKRNRKIIFWAILLTLLTTVILSATLARYTSTSTGMGNVNVGRWTDIKFEDSSTDGTTFLFDLADTKNTNVNVLDTQIAPGDEGSFDVSFGPSEVSYIYSLSVDNINSSDVGVPNIVFYSDSEMTTELTPETDIFVNLATAQTGFTKTIYWQWKYLGDIDAEDTADGLSDLSLTFEIDISATQSSPSET